MDRTTGHEGQPLYSSKIIDVYLRLVRLRYGHVDVPALLRHAGMELHQVEDEGHWFTQTQVDRFYEALVRASGSPGIAREAGRFIASPYGSGPIAHYVLGLAGPAMAFEAIRKLAASFTRSAVYESRRLGPTEIELTVVPAPGVEERPYQCENRIGYFEAIVAGFNYRLPRVEHEECVFSGGQACRYRISWQPSQAAAWKLSSNLYAAAGAVALPVLALVPPPGGFLAPAALVVFGFLGVSLAAAHLERRELSSAIENLRSAAERYLEDSSRNYDQALMISEIGHAVSAAGRVETMLADVMEVLRKRLDYDRGLILLADEEERHLEFRAGFGYGEELVGELRPARFRLDRPDSRGVFVLCFRERRPFLVNDVETIEEELSAHSLDFLRKVGSKSFICCPIVHEDRCLGVLAVDNLASKRPLLESDLNLLRGVAPEIGLAVSGALLAEERERQFSSILSTLAASIDARDNLTAGHSERVTEYAMAICTRMNVPADMAEVIRVASQLHDYGKIGIKDSILKKSGPLSGKEREEIKTHVVKTRDILGRVNFTGAYRLVPFIAGCHHERIDGTGYPSGLRGEEIPLGARILAVADFFEAITARRRYHEPLPVEEAVEMLWKESGHHLDSEVVEAMVEVVREGKVRLPASA